MIEVWVEQWSSLSSGAGVCEAAMMLWTGRGGAMRDKLEKVSFDGGVKLVESGTRFVELLDFQNVLHIPRTTSLEPSH
jgi:hypothetical protein